MTQWKFSVDQLHLLGHSQVQGQDKEDAELFWMIKSETTEESTAGDSLEISTLEREEGPRSLGSNV